METFGEVGSANANTPAVDVSGLGFAYRTGPVFWDVSFKVGAGETVAIIGPSGCGKSTLLRAVAGLLRVEQGRVGYHVQTDPDGVSVAMVFQGDTLIYSHRVGANVSMAMAFRRLPKRLRRQRATELLDLVGLGDYIDAYPRDLSGGMRRRVQFISAIAASPRILLLDEPFSSVDEPTRIGIHQDVFSIVRSRGIACLVVTHDLAEAISLSDRVIVLSPRPAGIALVKEIPLGDERDMSALRADATFLSLYGELWRALHTQIGRPAGREDAGV